MIQNRVNDCASSRLPSPAAVLAVAALLIPNIAWGFVEIARGELLFEATGRVSTDSNVFGNTTEQDDVIWSIEPALVYSRRAGRLNVDGRAGVTINRFNDFSDQDSNDKFVHLGVGLPTESASPLQGEFHLDYFNGRRVDVYVNDRIRDESISTGFQGSYRLDPLVDLRFGADYIANYPDQRSNSSERSVSIGAGYHFRPKANLFLDYRYRRSKSEFDRTTNLAIKNHDHALFLGVTGDLGPTLSGTISGGYQKTKADDIDSEGDYSQFVSAVSLAWQFRQRTALTFNATSDSSVTNAEQTVQKTGASLGLSEKIGHFVTAEGTIGWDRYRYRTTPTHRENVFNCGAKVSYVPNKTFSLGADVTYFSRDPGITGRFHRTVWGLSGTFSY